MNEARKKNFSKFNQREAYKKLGIRDIPIWQLDYQPLEPTDFFHERLRRLENFDLTLSERSKELLIDAVLEEVLLHHTRLKVWKAAALEGEDTIGIADYVLAEKRGYLEGPILCILEAKRDDFVQGEAQCLVSMDACRWMNAQEQHITNVFGIVSNGDAWVFYQLDTQQKVCKTPLYSLVQLTEILGICHQVFSLCEAALPDLAAM
jgi:hypothetical protein